jgi:hypothetical protein
MRPEAGVGCRAASRRPCAPERGTMLPRLPSLPAHDPAPAQPRGTRWLLLGAVMIGLLAMHFLSGHDSAGHHRPLATAAVVAAEQHAPAAELAARADDDHHSRAAPVPGDGADGHAIVAGCALLLAAAAILAILRRQTANRPPATPAAHCDRPRGPPKSFSRLALCVERI